MTCSTAANAAIPCRDGEAPIPVWWPGQCVGYHVNLDSFSGVDGAAAVNDLVDASFDAWSDVEGSYLTLVAAGDTTEDRAGYSPGCPGSGNANVVMIVSEGWPHQRTAVGITSVTYDPLAGRVYDADIELNDENFTLAIVTNPIAQIRATDLQNTLTHEVGHFVGLDHTLSATFVAEGDESFDRATMFASTDPGETSKRSLHLDDMEGIRAAYPDALIDQADACAVPNEGFFPRASTAPGSPCAPEDGCGGCGATPRSGTAPLASLVVGALLLGRKRRR